MDASAVGPEAAEPRRVGYREARGPSCPHRREGPEGQCPVCRETRLARAARKNGVEAAAGFERVARASSENRQRHGQAGREVQGDRKSTRLNSSHGYISYAV